jgi:hypothetical protein
MLQQLIDSFKNINIKDADKEPFLSICGFPHYERVASNIIAFFMDNKRGHEFGNLFLDALLSCVHWNVDEFGDDIQVETEIRTNKGYYIDILVTGKDKAICIENKIYAWLYNDLDDYWTWTSTKRKEVKGIVLSLYPQKKDNEKYTYITYEELFAKIKGRIGEYLLNRDMKYFPFLLDFIENIESLKMGINMDIEFIEFIKKNEEAVQKINRKLKEVHDQFRKKIQTVNNIVNEQINENNIKQWPWRELPNLCDVAVTDINMGQIKLVIHAEITLNGWRFCFFDRNGVLDVANYCEEKKIGGKIDQNQRYYLDHTFKIEETESNVASFVIKLINMVKEKDLTIDVADAR